MVAHAENIRGRTLPLKMSFHSITLFTEQSDLGPRPASFAASILLHGLVVAVAWFSIMYKPPFAKLSTEHFAVRQLDLRSPDEQRRAAAPRIAYPGPHSGPRAPASQGKPSPSSPAVAQLAQVKPGPQTLIQPDLLNPITLPDKIPMPQVLIWSPSHTPVRRIVPPLPQKPTAADIKPSIERPNEEMTLADVNIASSFHPSPRPLVTASTTAPVAVPLPQQVQLPPVTVSQPSEQPTPVAILSLSNMHMQGTAILPPVSESAAKNAKGDLATGQSKDLSQPSSAQVAQAPGQGNDLSQPGKDNSTSKTGQAGQGEGSAGNPNDHGPGTSQGPAGGANNPGPGTSQGPAGNASNHGSGTSQGTAAKGNDSASNAPAGKPEGPATGSANGTGAAGADGNPPSATVITLPKDGHFNSVIVGVSLEDQFPEMAGTWNGRMAYTVYLHVGLARSWILQYSLPRSADASASGTIARLDAPWPYNIVRPDLEPGSIDADALMIHGFVNQSGRFETLDIVFPQGFPQAQFVLAALEKWQFRPAMQDGQSAKVEVLLIIPEQLQ